jgi:TRAP-type C4-dicarboxylate transport system permease small subunit
MVGLNAFHLLGALDTIKKHIFKLIAVVGIAMLVFYSYFIYTGYEFWNTMQKKCTCAGGWQKYYIYLQTIAFTLIILLTVGLAGFSTFKRMSIGPSNLSVISTKRRSKRTIK